MVDRRGIEPRPEACKATVLPLSLSAHIKTHLNSPSTLVAISPTRGRICMCFNMVPQVGLEPTRLSALASKTSVATITPPGQIFIIQDIYNPVNLYFNNLVRPLGLEPRTKGL
jgi:hypothetical protein